MFPEKGDFARIYHGYQWRYGIISKVGRKWLSVLIGKRILRVLLEDKSAYKSLDN